MATSPLELRKSSPRNGTLIAIADAGPLYAAANGDDPDHEASLAALDRPDIHYVIPTLVVAEVTYFIATRLGAKAEARFLQSLEGLDVEAPALGDWSRMAELVERYSDFPLGGTDASVIAIAERLKARTIITLDRRHFGAVKPAHCDHFELLP